MELAIGVVADETHAEEDIVQPMQGFRTQQSHLQGSNIIKYRKHYGGVFTARDQL